MGELASLILEAKAGDDRAFESLVTLFQDMAVGYGYSILHDVHLAEDAAQEAFFEAFRTLDSLREPDAFPGWFRKIVFKQCDRLTRGKQPTVVPTDEMHETAVSVSPDQLQALESGEMKDRIWNAVETLPAHERETLVLFYIAGYSIKEVAAFLDANLSTIRKRLHSARNRLRDLLINEVEDLLHSHRPSRDRNFVIQTVDLIKAARTGNSREVKRLLAMNPRLLAARDPLGNTALVAAVNSGHQQLAEMLLKAGVRPDFFEAAAIGQIDLLKDLLKNQARVDQFSPEGFTALGLAAHFGHAETVQLLIDSGADVNIVSRHPLEVTPLHAALFGAAVFGSSSFGQGLATVRLLIEKGADINARRGGNNWPRAGWTPLHYCAGYGFVELIEELQKRGADVNCKDNDGKTPLRIAIEANQTATIELLKELAANE